MELPKYHETFIPILDVLNDFDFLKSRELATKVKERFYANLPQSLLEQETSSGTNILRDRISWGKSYLKMGKFVTYPKRGQVKITPKGKEALATGSLSLQDLQSDPDFVEHRNAVSSERSEMPSSISDRPIENASPQDLIDSGFRTIETEVKAELLQKLKELDDPYYFEKIVLILLKKMGYGDFIETPKSRDGGIDGIINEDKLGLAKIYTQAKLYTDTKIREKDIRDFIGAMSGDANKGVFITTSTFHEAAIKKAREATHSIVLIDGSRLVNLMHQYNVGVQVKTTYEIKEVDADFFEGE